MSNEQRDRNDKQIRKTFTKMYCAKRDDDEDSDLFRPCYKERKNERKKELTSGEIYLRSVIRERKTLPRVTRCNVDLTKFRNNQTVFVEELRITPVPRALRPTALQDSRDEQYILCGFDQARDEIKKLRANRRNLNFEIEDLGNFGMQPVAEWNRFFNRQPTLSCVLGLRQLPILNGLKKLVRIAESLPAGQHISQQTGAWMYTFLVIVHEPVTADIVSVLRQFARLCADKMCEINLEDENATTIAAPYNLFITLISEYFKQFDLRC